MAARPWPRGWAGSCWPHPHSTKYLLSNLVRGTDSWVSPGNLSRLLPWAAAQRAAQYRASDAFFPPCLRRRLPARIPTACAASALPSTCSSPALPPHSSVIAQPSPLPGLELLHVSVFPKLSSPFLLSFSFLLLFFYSISQSMPPSPRSVTTFQPFSLLIYQRSSFHASHQRRFLGLRQCSLTRPLPPLARRLP